MEPFTRQLNAAQGNLGPRSRPRPEPRTRTTTLHKFGQDLEFSYEAVREQPVDPGMAILLLGARLRLYRRAVVAGSLVALVLGCLLGAWLERFRFRASRGW